MPLRSSIALVLAVLAPLATSCADGHEGGADAGETAADEGTFADSTRRDGRALRESARRETEIFWPIAPGVSTFVTQSAARSDEPFPCGSGVNAQHILHDHGGENHDYEHSFDIVARGLGQEQAPHEGRGLDVVASADGIVVASRWDGSECDRELGAGNFVILEHPQLEVDGRPVLSAYMHLNSRRGIEEAHNCSLNPAPTSDASFEAPVVGQRVAAGEKIGELGNTGNSTGTHLHFQFASECLLEPASDVHCPALPILALRREGFANLQVARDASCPAPLGVGGPGGIALPQTRSYLSDGSYVTSRLLHAESAIASR